ncbi:hypothetical protein [Paenibacillus lutrae]|uniref:hypothetical protein n=1 Tax=Paenibacillus lutrae TaxID=2078573 RepID=UPI0012F79CE2|nr:hypothetical protein [Paenibacillus lutrae]
MSPSAQVLNKRIVEEIGFLETIPQDEEAISDFVKYNHKDTILLLRDIQRVLVREEIV